ncbi:flagellar protein FlaG [Azospirillum sp. TSO35-2]|uniref:flagellar protein FlaG n=1 Tax=Azospirillum sp. TSO35-2 TaxID=716796 RepID=UPI000D616872|nr:flagellar protein FlaG [Azospirillum sp. TSO35-2]PWC37801.1 hypothetical protein TSO352_10015 [Azospirillum sp. TSO35-2]
MPTPINGVTGPTSERAPASADLIAEARQRQADRLRAAQAETTKPAEVVERTAKSDAAENDGKNDRKVAVQPYRVNLDPDTRRLYTEVLDTATGDVIMRIPAGYVDPKSDPGTAEAAADGETPDVEPSSTPPASEVTA